MEMICNPMELVLMGVAGCSAIDMIDFKKTTARNHFVQRR
jgi:uncharacterized OsmC-like protein